MSTWTPNELDSIERAEELSVASRRRDGSLSPYVTIWVIRAGEDIYIRSAYGANNTWFRNAQSRGAGRIRAGGVERDVHFVQPSPGVHDDIDAAYHRKYDRHGPQIVGTVVGPAAATVTLKVDPAGGRS